MEKVQENHRPYVLWPKARLQASKKICADFSRILLNIEKKPTESHFFRKDRSCQWRSGSPPCDAIGKESLAKILKVVQTLLHYDLISHPTTSRITWGGKLDFPIFHQRRILAWWISQIMPSALEILDGLLSTLAENLSSSPCSGPHVSILARSPDDVARIPLLDTQYDINTIFNPTRAMHRS